MDRLILLRHGKAEADAPSGRDFDRPLTDRGKRDVELVARKLAKADQSPDLVLVSPAIRAKETWEAAAPFFPDARVAWTPELYQIDADEILDMAKEQTARTVMVVGHNPGLGELAAYLARQVGSADMPGFPTAAAAVIDFDHGGPSPAWVFELYTPKTLGGGA